MAQIAVLIALVYILKESENVWFCAITYSLFQFILSLGSATKWVYPITIALISLPASYLYFWLLKKFKDTIFWYVILIVGPIVLFINPTRF